MVIIAYIWIFFVIFTSLFFFLIVFIDKRIKEDTPFGKWWRNNIVGIESKDDITK